MHSTVTNPIVECPTPSWAPSTIELRIVLDFYGCYSSSCSFKEMHNNMKHMHMQEKSKAVIKSRATCSQCRWTQERTNANTFRHGAQHLGPLSYGSKARHPLSQQMPSWHQWVKIRNPDQRFPCVDNKSNFSRAGDALCSRHCYTLPVCPVFEWFTSQSRDCHSKDLSPQV